MIFGHIYDGYQVKCEPFNVWQCCILLLRSYTDLCGSIVTVGQNVKLGQNVKIFTEKLTFKSLG
jgi:hypothetical protein